MGLNAPTNDLDVVGGHVATGDKESVFVICLCNFKIILKSEFSLDARIVYKWSTSTYINRRRCRHPTPQPLLAATTTLLQGEWLVCLAAPRLLHRSRPSRYPRVQSGLRRRVSWAS